MKNNKGFTLVELLVTIAIIGIIFTTVSFIIKGTLAATDSTIEQISDNQIFSAANSYVLEENVSFNEDGYACVTTKELMDYGYIKYNSDENKIIKIIRDPQTMVVHQIKYVDVCE